MFSKSYLNKCNRYMYLECNKKEVKEEFKLPKVIDYPIAKKELLKILNANKEDTNKEFIYNNYITKVDLIKDDIYYMFNFSKTGINDIKLLKISYDNSILKMNNIKITRFIYVNINGKYIKNGDIDFNEFFIFNDITDNVLDFNFDKLEKSIADEQKNCFNLTCKKCPYIKYCINDVCKFEESIFSLRGKIDNLIDKKIYKISEVDKSLLDKYQLRQIEEKEYIDKNAIRDVLDKIEYPINFIDFEKANLIIPFLDGNKCNQGLFFQYSLDILSADDLKHYEYMIESYDQLECLAIELDNRLAKGSVVCYNTTAEKDAIKTLSRMFPNLNNLKVNDDRYVDLSVIFTNMYYYNFKMHGSSSIKSVLPALANISYDSLNGVENGIEAASSFVELKYSSNDEKEKIKKEMLEYCNLDTKAMYIIYNKLIELIK